MSTKSLFKRLIVCLVIVIFASGLAFSKKKPRKTTKIKVKKGAIEQVVSGTLIHWKDIEKKSFSKDQPRKMRAILNFQNPQKLKKRKKKDRDPVAQTWFKDKKRKKGLDGKEALAMSDPIANFAGMNQSSNGAGWPPDTNGDVGENYYIQTVNTSIGIYNKSTGAQVSATTFDAFFPSSVGTPCNNDNNGDPIVLYDRYNSRWFILDFAWSGTSNGSYYSIAASQTSDPTGAWYTYCLKADNTLMNDYPKCGVWHDGIYITANMFQFSGSYQHSKIWAIKTPDLYSGTLTSQNVTDSGSRAFSLMPSSAKSPTAPPSSAPNYMYAMSADEFSGGVDALFVWKYNIDWNNSSNTTWTGPSQMNTAAFTISSTRVSQSGTSQTLDTLYGRLMYPANYWNFGTHESVILSHVADYSSRRGVRWYEIRINSGNSSIFQQGTYSPDSSNRWMGSAAINKNGDIAIGYSVSSSSMYPAIRYAGRKSTDTAGTMGQGEKELVAGGGSQTNTNRWGDYASLFVDPSDDETFWFTTEYYTSSGSVWRTRVGSFQVGGTTPPPQYCTSAGSNSSYEWVARAQVGDLDKSSGAAGYSDYTSDVAHLAPGGSVSVTLTPGFSSSTYTEYWKIWIDYNNDKDFDDAGEEVFSGTGTSAVSGNFTVPTGLSGTTRMRISMKWDAAPTSCETFSYGEVEDYTVEFSGTPPPTYCTASGNNQNYEWVSRVRIGSLDNSSSASGYTDYTGQSVSLSKGGNVSVYLTPGFASSSYTENWRIYIDYNQDGDFTDSGETAFSGSGSSTVSGSFTVPTSAATGSTRIRVVMNYSSSVSSCGTFTYGEVEDYTANIN